MISKQVECVLPKEWLYVIPGCDDNYVLYAPLHKKAVKIKPHTAKGIIPILNGDLPKDDLQTEIFNFLTDYNSWFGQFTGGFWKSTG